MNRIRIVSSIVFPLASCVAATSAQEAGFLQLAERFDELCIEKGVVGGALSVQEGSRIVRVAYHGFADAKSKRAVDGDTIFHWASVTKTFTAVALMQLEERGALALDDPVVRFVPELREVHA